MKNILLIKPKYYIRPQTQHWHRKEQQWEMDGKARWIAKLDFFYFALQHLNCQFLTAAQKPDSQQAANPAIK